MGAGGTVDNKPGMGRPMTPFSMPQDGMQGGMQGFNTGMPGDAFKQFQQMQNPVQKDMSFLAGGNPSNYGQMMQAPGMTPFGQFGGAPNMNMMDTRARMPGNMNTTPFNQLSYMANMIQGQGQMPQNMMPYQQAPQSSTQMQQGLGGLAAYMGRGS
jgi:hypothetical protein